MKIPALTKTEETVMVFLWKQDRPLSVQEMINSWEGEEKTWKARLEESRAFRLGES